MSRQQRTQKLEIFIPSGTDAGTITKVVELDTSFDRCTGVVYYPVGNGGQAYYNMGISDDDHTYHDLQNKAQFSAGTNLRQDDRFYFLDIELKGSGKVKVNIELTKKLTSDLTGQAIFRLENDVEYYG